MPLVKQNNPDTVLNALSLQGAPHSDVFVTELFTAALAAPPSWESSSDRSAPKKPGIVVEPSVIRHWHPAVCVVTGPKAPVPARTEFHVRIFRKPDDPGWSFETVFPMLGPQEPAHHQATGGPWTLKMITAWWRHFNGLGARRKNGALPAYARLIQSFCPDGYDEAFVRRWTNPKQGFSATGVRFWLSILYLTGHNCIRLDQPALWMAVVQKLRHRADELLELLYTGRSGQFSVAGLQIHLSGPMAALLQAFLLPLKQDRQPVPALPPDLADLGQYVYFAPTSGQWGLSPAVFSRVHSILSTSRKSDGVFYTPSYIARYMCVQNQIAPGGQTEQARILDPSCGGGVFLQAALAAYPPARVEGWDIDRAALDFCRATLPEKTQVVESDALRLEESPAAGYESGRDTHHTQQNESSGSYDLILSNPPYEILNRKDSPQIDPELWPKFKKTYPWSLAAGGKKNLYQLFIARMLTLLKNGGRLKVICPMGILADRSAERLRQEILDHFRIERIDVFPERDNKDARLFSDAKMSVCILHIRRTGPLGKIPVFVYRRINGIWKGKKTSIARKTVTDIDPSSRPIPIVTKGDALYLGMAAAHNRRIDGMGRVYEGELNMTFHKHLFRPMDTAAPRLAQNELAVIKGAAVQRYIITAGMSQGKPVKVAVEEVEAAIPKKAGLYKLGRIVMQGITGINEKTRLKMSWLPPGFCLANSTNYLIPQPGTDPFTLLALLNSRAANWYFRMLSTNSNVNTYEVHRLPVPPLVCARQLSGAAYALWRCRAMETESLLAVPGIGFRQTGPARPQLVTVSAAIPEGDLLEEYIEALVWEAYFPKPFHAAFGSLAGQVKTPDGFEAWQTAARRKTGLGAIGSPDGFFRRAGGPVEIFS